MKKIFISIILIFWIFSQNSQIFASQLTVSPESFSQFLQNIWESKWDLNSYIERKDVWKISLEMVGFSPENKSDLNYIREISDQKILWDEKLKPNEFAKKYETLKFLFSIFWVNTPFFNDQIMDFADVKNDDPIVSKCLQLWICEWQNSKIFWKNSPITRAEFYQYLIKTYSFVYWDSTNSSENFEKNISSDDKKFLILENIFETIKTEYYKRDDLEKDDLIYWAAEWMAAAVWDKYTKFFRPAKSQSFNESLDWNFEWIWAYIEHDENWIRIVTPMNWSPAQEAWLKWWDLILEADWNILKDFTLEEWVSFIKWKSWTFVKLKIQRWNDILYFNVQRWKVVVTSVESEKLENEILYIKINQFWQNTDKELFQILFDNMNSEKIIFDLRDNPWWYLEVAKNILSMFIESWEPIVKIKYPNFETTNYSSEKIDKFEGKKIAILTNWWSASASEIFAWTMQDYWLAKIFWETTYWKWTVQTLIDFYDWSQFKVTIANWKTWLWRLIEWEWVDPDEQVFEDEWKFWDEVLNKAKNYLK